MLRSLTLSLAVGLVMGPGLGASTGSAGADAVEFFELKIRPVLVESCVKCHGPDKAGNDLRLDSIEAIREGGLSGPAIDLDDPEGSLLVQAMGHKDDVLKMPPDGPLDARVVADFRDWIAQGAAWPASSETTATLVADRHWAFEPLSTLEPPIDPSGWAESDVDRHIAAGHRALGLHPVNPADRRTLIRRVTYDLIGLPPEPERLAEFEADDRPDAYERLVDELLASPRYGERWGRYWLDLARYADTAGDNSDYPIPEAYRYRDYVIDAFNRDIPYDRFLHEQLAGDILAREAPADDYARLVTATGFIAQAKRFGTQKLEDIHQIIEDTLNTTGQVVLGLSMRCARCHDHKFDPISSRDYYAMYGIFSSTSYPFAGSEEDRKPSEFAPLATPDVVAAVEAEHAQAIASLKAQIDQIESGALGQRASALKDAVGEAEQRLQQSESSVREAIERELEALKADETAARSALDEALKPVREALATLEKTSPLEKAAIPMAYAVREGKPADAAIQKGGNPRDLGPVVARGVPRILDDDGVLEIPEGVSGRLELARWLTNEAAHLTARVLANRVWQNHMGSPIVATPSDFGLRGTPPTHPELLDHLAHSLIANGWSIKALHREILLSKTYRLASTEDSENAAIDSGNGHYWRFHRRRLDAEALRDSLLQLGGNLKPGRPGPHPFPPKDKWRFTAHHQFKAEYPSEFRSVYLMVQRLHPHPYLKLFNGPDTSMTTAVRDRSSVPLQALFLLNNPFIHEQSRRFADRLISEASDTPSRTRLAYLRIYGRPPTDADRLRVQRFLESHAAAAGRDGSRSDDIDRAGWAAIARAMMASNEFVFVD